MPDSARLIPDCRVSVDGQKLDPAEDGRLTRVDVDLDAQLFGRCEIVFNDPRLQLINGTKFQSGTAVKVEIGFGANLVRVFEGEVVALEPRFRRDLPPALHVVCHEAIHRLALSQMTRALNDVDDNDVVAKIAQEHGLSGEGPSGTKTHLLQSNVTDAVLLRRLAQKEGNQLRIEGKKLVIGPPPQGAQVKVGPGDGLRKIKVKIKSVQQVSEISVHGWDPKTRQEIVGKTRAPAGEAGDGARQHGAGKTLSFAGHEHAPVDVASAERMAKGRLARIAEGFVTAELEMIGDPRVVPGTRIELDKIGAQADGTWRVDKAGHFFSKRGYLVKAKITRVSRETSSSKAQEKQARQQAAEAAPEEKKQPEKDREPTVFSAGVRSEAVPEGAEARVSGEPSAEHGDARVSGEAEEAQAATPSTPSVIATLDGVHFEFDKAFALPGAIPTFRGVAAFLQAEPGRRVLVAGHTDQTGDDDYNLALSRERAEIASAALRGDVGVWYAHYQHQDAGKRWGDREDGLMLKALGFLAKDPKEASAAEIQDAWRQCSVESRGEPNPAARKALLRRYLDLYGIPGVAVGSVTVLGCGERHPKRGASDAELRRVEIFLFDGEIQPAADACGSARHPGCTAYDAWIGEVTGEVPPGTAAPAPKPDADRIQKAQAKVDELKEKFAVAIVPRADWGARPHKPDDKWVDYPAGQPLPLSNIVVHHTSRVKLIGGGEHLTPKELQDFEMDQNHFSDVPYHFLITADGKIFEGREMKSVGAHAGELTGNSDIHKDPDWGSVGIVLMGDFEAEGALGDEPTAAQLESLGRLTGHLLLEHEGILPDHVFKHSEVKRSGAPKACPGKRMSPHVEQLRTSLDLQKIEAALKELRDAKAGRGH